MDDKIRKIKASATPAEVLEIEVLERAVSTTLADYQADFTAARRRNWEDAKQGLAEAVDRVFDKYFPSETVYPHLMAALAFLQEGSWKVSKSKLYQDAAAGKLVTEAGNRVRESALLAYAFENLQQTAEEGKPNTLRPLIEEEKKLDVSLKKRKDEQAAWEFEREQGKWIPKKDLGLELAARAGWFDSQLENMIRSHAVDWIRLVGGHPQKEQQLVEDMLAKKDLVVGEFASMDMAHVLFKREE